MHTMTVAALPPPLRAVIPTAAKGYAMQLDRNSLDRLLRLNDDQLRGVLGKLLVEYGVDVSRVPLQQMDMKALRAVLAAATDEDITRFLQSFGGSPQGGRR